MGPVQTQIFNSAKTITSSNEAIAEFASTLLPNPANELLNRQQNKKVDLNSIFPTQQEENKLTKSRRILGEIANDISDDELEAHLAKFEYLLDLWLDKFEKDIFNNKTLNQLLREG